jgi:chemotaxis response regulator CheB
MLDIKMDQTRVAILATSDKTQLKLTNLLLDAGLDVVMRDLPNDDFLSQIEKSSADVLLVDLTDGNGSEIDIIDTLLDYDKLPIFFNDSSSASGGANALWAKKLARKLAKMACEFQPRELNKNLNDALSTSAAKPIKVTHAPAPVSEPPAATEDEETVSKDEVSIESCQSHPDASQSKTLSDEPSAQATQDFTAAENDLVQPANPEQANDAAINIWVLGASLGGPQAVRQFLAAIEADLPVAFILAQHIGANHISLLAEQLDRITPFKVTTGRSGHLLKHHEVVLAPADKSLSITEDGYVSLSPAPENAIYSPSIDQVMTAVAQRYRNMAGTIIFSGMGDDGARGCVDIAEQGGVVWAQDVASCVISSMPDQARKTNAVTYSADPHALAERLYRYYSE